VGFFPPKLRGKKARRLLRAAGLKLF